jgi:nucleoside 2-deoxyribosyltransferase
MSSPVGENINRVNATAWTNVVAVGFALTLASGMIAGPAWGGEDPKTAAKRTLYLANPYGFSAQQREGPLEALMEALGAVGAEVWEPFSRNNQIDRTTPGWTYRIGQADLRDVREADALFAVVNGCPPDEGVMVELGMAIAWDKPVFLFRDDFRRCTDSETYPLNLMVFTGLPEAGWQAYWYGSVNEIAEPDKALAQWLKDGTLP